MLGNPIKKIPNMAKKAYAYREENNLKKAYQQFTDIFQILKDHLEKVSWDQIPQLDHYLREKGGRLRQEYSVMMIDYDTLFNDIHHGFTPIELDKYKQRIEMIRTWFKNLPQIRQQLGIRQIMLLFELGKEEEAHQAIDQLFVEYPNYAWGLIHCGDMLLKEIGKMEEDTFKDKINRYFQEAHERYDHALLKGGDAFRSIIYERFIRLYIQKRDPVNERLYKEKLKNECGYEFSDGSIKPEAELVEVDHHDTSYIYQARECFLETLHDGITQAKKCPRCGSQLENEQVMYQFVTSDNDLYELQNDFGFFCTSCPTVVLNFRSFFEAMDSCIPGKKYHILGTMKTEEHDKVKKTIFPFTKIYIRDERGFRLLLQMKPQDSPIQAKQPVAVKKKKRKKRK